MAKTVILNIKVNDAELEDLEKGLEELGADFNVVDSSAKKTGKSVKDLGLGKKTLNELDKYTKGWASSIYDVGVGLKDVVRGLNLSKAALIGTGIGAFVVALGAIVAYWDDIVDYITGANESLEDQLDLMESKISVLEAEIKLIDRQIELEHEQNRNIQDLIDKKRELLNFQLDELRIQKLILEQQYAQEASDARRVTFWEAMLGRGAQLTAEELENLSEIEGKILETELAILNLQALLSGDISPIKTKKSTREKERKVDPITGEDLDKEKEALTKRMEELFGIREEFRNAELEKANEFANSDIAITARRERAKRDLEAAMAKERERIAKIEAQAKLESYMLAADGFATASRLIGQETAAGKAFSVAATLISTYLSAQKAYQSQISIPTPDAPARAAAAAAIAVASGLANVKEILRTKIPGYEGSYGSVGAGASIPPAFNVVGTSPQNQLNQALLEQNREPLEAFVVEGKVSTAEQLRRGKINASSIG